MDGYRTVAGPASGEYTERRSRFIGQIAPVRTEEEALAFVAEAAAAHRAAAHNVFAYRLREPAPGVHGLSRCSDNGEPQGTAGVPVLDVLQKEGLTDVCVVVTRYFGGVLLGAGGLVRAYSHAAALAVGAAAVRAMAPCVRLRVVCDYSFFGRLESLLPEHRVLSEASDFGAAVTLTLQIRADRLPAFERALTEASNGQVRAERLAEFFADLA